MVDLLKHNEELVDAKTQLLHLKENCEEMNNKQDELTVTLTIKGMYYQYKSSTKSLCLDPP